MSDQILELIYDFSKKFNDPISNKPLDKNNKYLNIDVKNGNVIISLDIDSKNIEKANILRDKLKKELENIKGVLSLNIVFTAEKPANLNNKEKNRFSINSKNIIAIASGKGGVGKSTFSVNFAVALSQLGQKVGLLDADVYGPSIPRMMGATGKPEVNQNKKLVPIERYGVKCMSIGFLIDTDTPAIWRGPMVMKALEQMFLGVEWGSLDYLIIDLPPGTGDAQLTLAQNSKLSGSIIISTPQDIALLDAKKGINMFIKVKVPIIGLIENMSYFICDNCNEKHFIFSNNGARKEAENFNIKFLGALPLEKSLRIQSDEGRPCCIDDPNGSLSKKYKEIAEYIIKSEN